MVCTFEKAPPVAYFREVFAYYGDGHLSARWYAPDSGLGVEDNAEISFDELERLYAAEDRNGKSYLSNKGGHTATRQAAFDLTFTPAKSFALLYAMANDEDRAELIEALFLAVRTSLETVTTVAGWARRGKAGRRLERVLLTAAMFFHDDARPEQHSDGTIFGDPDPHIHALVLNLAKRSDGSFGAVQSVLIRMTKMLAGAIFHASLAAELVKLKFSVDRNGKNGIFEVAGIGQRAIEFFSARSNKKKQILAEAGTTSTLNPKLAARVIAASRRKKVRINFGERLKIWQDAAARNGIDYAGELSSARKSFRPLDPAQSEEEYQSRLELVCNELTETEAVLHFHEVLRRFHEALVGTGLPPARARKALADMIKARKVLVVGKDAMGSPMFSTPNMVATELAVIELAQAMAERGNFGIDPETVRKSCSRFGLTDEQRTAAMSATRSGGIAVVEGAPGVGNPADLGLLTSSFCSARSAALVVSDHLSTRLRCVTGIEWDSAECQTSKTAHPLGE